MAELELVILQWANLAILIFAILIVLRRPAREFLQTRREKLRLIMEKAGRDVSEAQGKYVEAKKRQVRIQRDAEELKQALIDSGEFIRRNIIQEAQQTAERIRKESHLLAAHEFSSAYTAIQHEILKLAFEKADITLQGGIPEENQKQLFNSSLNTLRQIDLKEYVAAIQ